MAWGFRRHAAPRLWCPSQHVDERAGAVDSPAGVLSARRLDVAAQRAAVERATATSGRRACSRGQRVQLSLRLTGMRAAAHRLLPTQRGNPPHGRRGSPPTFRRTPPQPVRVARLRRSSSTSSGRGRRGPSGPAIRFDCRMDRAHGKRRRRVIRRPVGGRRRYPGALFRRVLREDHRCGPAGDDDGGADKRRNGDRCARAVNVPREGAAASTAARVRGLGDAACPAASACGRCRRSRATTPRLDSRVCIYIRAQAESVPGEGFS